MLFFIHIFFFLRQSLKRCCFHVSFNIFFLLPETIGYPLGSLKGLKLGKKKSNDNSVKQIESR